MARLRAMLSACLKTRRRKIFCAVLLLCAVPLVARLGVLVMWTVPIIGGRSLMAPHLKATRGLTYFHDEIRKVPWSIHVVKVSRNRPGLELHSALGQGTSFGMAPVSEQVKLHPPERGRIVAAVNGDLYFSDPAYPGDPEGLQIVHGELVSGPSASRVCFWIDAAGHPHRGDVRSRFQVIWPDGSAAPLGLNEARARDAAVLYTAAVGRSTRTQGGLELRLERPSDGRWLPLQVGQTYAARVREVSQAGNLTLSREEMVLSLGPVLLARVPKTEAGATLKISLATTPDLTGARTAIGGGPSLVVDGKARAWPGLRLRHPRTALGWNREYYFLVVVDGRQLRVSAGMTLLELAEYMVKLGCEEAMNLDGGGSATCWLYGNVMNSPSQGHERRAANSLVVLQKGTPSLAPALP